MVKIHLDFESFSCMDIKTVGGFRYAEDPSTEILIVGWSIDNDEPVAVDMTSVDALSQLTPLFDLVAKGAIIGAHNSHFERVMWEKVGVPKHGFPVTPKPEAWDCTAARARMLAIPGSLDGAASALGLQLAKDPRGSALIQLFSKPHKTKGRCLPADRPDEFKEFMEYCVQDVRLEVQLDRILPPLIQIERDAFLLDYRINDIGMPVNMDRVKAADAFVDEYSVELTNAAVMIAGCRPSQVQKTRDYLETRGYTLDNLQAGTVEWFMNLPNLPEDIYNLMRYRIELSRAGTKKLKAIKSCVSADGRIRGGFLFSAASTRRWSSTGVQMHNLQTPEGECNPNVVMELLDGTANDLTLLFEWPLTVLAQSVRGFFESDQNFIVADYSSVEPRGLAWSAGEDWLLDAYHKGEDVYKIAAGRVYNMAPTKIAKDSRERFVGKQIILGCFGPDTEVLTRCGWKRIVEIQLDDQLWDGVEFVSHDGVISQGRKETLNLCGLVATPDHRIWTGRQFVPSEQIMEDPSGSLLQSALSSATLPLSHTGSGQPEACSTTNANVFVERHRSPIRGTSKPGSPLAAQDAPLRLREMPSVKQYLLRLLDNLSPPSIRRLSASFATCIIGWFKNALEGLTGIRSTTFGFANAGPTSRTSSKMLLNYQGGGRTQCSTERTTSETTSQAIAGSSPTQSQTTTPSEVYDIVNSGKRQRFTVRCSRGALIVHNCGYGMGAERFVDTCATKAVPPLILSFEEAEKAVYGYRNSVPAITAFWRQTNSACIKAVRKWQPVQFGRFTARPETLANGFPVLYIDMPSGSICYPKPSLGTEEWAGELRNTFEFYTPYGSSFLQTDTFGGSLVENIIQAQCRDVLRDGMLAADAAGFKVAGHCHDEAIAEGEGTKDELREFEHLLCNSSLWAKGFPIATEGFVSKTYRK